MLKVKNNKWNGQLNSAKELLRLLLPTNKQETALLLIFFVAYFLSSLSTVLNSSIIDTYRVFTDNYFSYDSPVIFRYGLQNIEGHPYLYIYTKPIIFIGEALFTIFGTIKAKTLFIVLFCNYLIASSVLFIYRYLKDVIDIKGYILYILVLFYSMLSTNLALCFTFESFTFSVYALTFSIYYYSYKIKQNEGVSFSASLMLCLSLGGITITNFAKGIIPILFTKDKMAKSIKKIAIISLVFGITLLILELIFDLTGIIRVRYNLFAVPNVLNYEYIIDNFFGAPILFPDIITTPNEYYTDCLTIVTDFYRSAWQYIFIGILFTFLISSMVIGRKNKLIQIIALLWSVDIVLHIALKYGINDSFIFGGHWVYVTPLLLAWLYKSFPRKLATTYTVVLTIMLIVLILNNTYTMHQFANIASEIFPLENYERVF